MKFLAKLEAKAYELGFTSLGITDTNVSEHVSFLETWLESGFHGSMKWLEQHLDLRKDPTRLVGAHKSDFRSARLFAENTNCIDILNDPDKAYISRYALGRDYHKLMRKRLRHLGDWLTEKSNLMDFGYFQILRPFSKSTSLKKPDSDGSANTHYCYRAGRAVGFSGELLTDCPLPLTQTTEQSRCGSCTACIDICLTNAFPEPYQLDANKCISYLTIEHKGSIQKN